MSQAIVYFSFRQWP